MTGKKKKRSLKTHSAFGLIGKGAYFYVQNDPVLQWGDWLIIKGKLPASALQTSLRHAFRGGLGQLPVQGSSLWVTCTVKIPRKVLALVVISLLRKRM